MDRGETRGAKAAGLASLDQGISLFGSIAEPSPAVGLDNAVVRSSHSRHAMTALLRSGERFQMVLRTTFTLPHVRLLVRRILQLDQSQRQPVHEAHQIRPPRLLRPGDRELVHHQEIIAARPGEIDQLRVIRLILPLRVGENQ